ncbi:MAG TPA: oxygenase MpaB family protein [Candidatus Limnocylindrales bacterium]|nr:oxygenase MpaB family protein [Candidatus Limnocylindrales bacterium]
MARRPAAKRPLTTAAGDLAGLYGPGSEGWRLNREAALLLGAGPFALLLQVAHPLVAEGVIQHSSFRTDPWGRLAGTLRSYLQIVYGTTPAARAEIARLNGLHGGVTGPVRDAAAAARLGATYRARDPELALWVHATLIHAILLVTDRWQAPLAPDVRARFYAETRPVGRLFGVADHALPRDIEAFDAYVDAMLSPRGPVHPTDAAREIAATILRPPLAGVVRSEVAALLGDAAPLARRALGLVPQAAVDALMVPAIGLLPAATRAEYGLAWGPRERAIDAWLVTAWRFWIPRLPPSFRWFPQALAADARMAGGA